MTLHAHPNHPSAGCYVLKLHRDAAPQRGQLVGRLEHIVSGDSIDFVSTADLIAWLMRHAAQVQVEVLEAPAAATP